MPGLSLESYKEAPVSPSCPSQSCTRRHNGDEWLANEAEIVGSGASAVSFAPALIPGASLPSKT